MGWGLLETFEANEMLGYRHSGYSVDAGVRIEAHDERIAALARRRTHRHRYFGVLAPNSPLRAAVTAMALLATAQPATGQAGHRSPCS